MPAKSFSIICTLQEFLCVYFLKIIWLEIANTTKQKDVFILNTFYYINDRFFDSLAFKHKDMLNITGILVGRICTTEPCFALSPLMFYVCAWVHVLYVYFYNHLM